MSSFLRWPRRYRVMVRGSNFSATIGDETKPVHGFYTNRWVNAFDEEEAVAKAFGSVRDRLREKRLGSVADAADLKADEIVEVNLWKQRFAKTQGFVFFADE